jgi:hypothetical protein
MIEFDSNGIAKRWEILDDQHLDAFLRKLLKENESHGGNKDSDDAYPVHSCYCTSAPVNDGYITFSKGVMQLKEAKNSPPLVTLTPKQISKISFDTPISEKNNSPEPAYFHLQLRLKEKIGKRKVLYLKIQAATLYEFLRFETSAVT